MLLKKAPEQQFTPSFLLQFLAGCLPEPEPVEVSKIYDRTPFGNTHSKLLPVLFKNVFLPAINNKEIPAN